MEKYGGHDTKFGGSNKTHGTGRALEAVFQLPSTNVANRRGAERGSVPQFNHNPMPLSNTKQTDT